MTGVPGSVRLTSIPLKCFGGVPVCEGRLHKPLSDAEVLETVLELRVGHPNGEAFRGVFGGGVEVEP